MPDSKSQETVTRLKELLFDREARELDTLNTRLEELQKRAGSDEQFQKTVTRVLEWSIRDAEKVQHRELSDAMAPMVLRTMRAEMKSAQMQDQIAGVMYPRMGEMVSRYVSSAIRDMMEEINRRLEAGLTRNRLMLWLRSIVTGRSMAELALAATQRLEVNEIYLVRRGSGSLVHHWRRPGSSEPPAGANRDTLVSGFLTAITAFSEEAFEADKQSLRTLDLDNHRIYLRGSPDYLLAAKCNGSAPAGVERVLDAELIRVLGEHRVIEAVNEGVDRADVSRRLDTVLADSAAAIEETAREMTREASGRRGMRTLKWIVALVGLPLAALVAWQLYVGFVTRQVQTRVTETLAGIEALKGYPVRAIVERGAQRIRVTGLARDGATRQLVLDRLIQAAPGVEITEAIGVLPASGVEEQLDAESFRRSLERAKAKLLSVAVDLGVARLRALADDDRSAIAAAETAARKATLELERASGAAGSSPLAQPLQEAIAELTASAARLSALAQAEATVPLAPPRTATEGAEQAALLADRVGTALIALGQRAALAPVASRVDELGARASDIEKRAAEKLAEVENRYQRRIAELEGKIAALQPLPPTPRQKLEAFTRRSVIFFGTEADYRLPDFANAVLTELAQLLKDAAIPIRVVGYTDDLGGAQRNSPLAQARADRVTADLVARGVPRELLTAVGRLTGMNLAPGTGVDSPNRRVEFEIAFPGEKGGRP